MKRLSAPTEDFAKGESGRLASDATAGSNVTITLDSNDGLANGDYVAIGYEGNELCELAQINQAISGNTQIRVATLKFNHVAGEPIRVYRYDKRKFYGATSATGSYTQLTGDGSPKLIEVDDPMGTTIEYSGSTYTYFKATYYNSTLDTETDIDDATAVLGDQSARYTTLYAIRKHAGLAGNPRYSESHLEEKRAQAENEIKSVLASIYVLPLSYVPPLITRLCTLLAAGYIDYEEFGEEGDGKKWLGEARGILKAIKDGKQILLDADDVQLTTIEGSNSIDGYPNDEDTDCPKMTMDKTF